MGPKRSDPVTLTIRCPCYASQDFDKAVLSTNHLTGNTKPNLKATKLQHKKTQKTLTKRPTTKASLSCNPDKKCYQADSPAPETHMGCCYNKQHCSFTPDNSYQNIPSQLSHMALTNI